jgi:uncharacterized Zn finger protein
MGWSRGWAPYVPVAKRRAQAAKELAKLDKSSKGKARSPVHIATRKMAVTFWGEAWCDNLENYSDYSNRLPRGRSYARNGSILDLQIEKGCVTAMVSGSSLYSIKIEISTIPANLWKNIKSECAKSIHSIMDLLRGKLSDSVMKCLTAPKVGMFPQPKEIKMRCSCPDSAGLCKHLAAVMYGIGNRLDTVPELLFTLRGVDKSELVSEAVSSSQLSDSLTSNTKSKNKNAVIANDDLSSLFGIDLVEATPKADSTAKKKPAKKKVVTNAKAKATPPTKVAKKKPASQKPVPKKPASKKASVVRTAKAKQDAQQKSKKKIKPISPTKPDLRELLRVAMENQERMESGKQKR